MLSPTDRDVLHELYRALEDRVPNAMVDTQNRLIEGIAAHFPGLAPAIRAVALHVSEPHPDADEDDCGCATCWSAVMEATPA